MKSFNPDDTFPMKTTFIRTPGPGRGDGKRYKPSAAAVRGIVKRSRVTIKNKDDLCCERTIVTMKARVDGVSDDADCKNMLRGRPIQTHCAKELHRLAEAPEGPCGIRELQQFQAALLGYELKAISIDPPHMLIYAAATPSDKIIGLIKEGEHYDGCNSFKGFLSRSYFCDDCNRGYNNEDFNHHTCHGKRCLLAIAKAAPISWLPNILWDQGPGNFPTPRFICRLCHREFFGEDCYAHHLMRRAINIRSVCDTHKKCPDCRHVYKLDPRPRRGRPATEHQCGWGECLISEEQVELATHQCYIQRLPENGDDSKTQKNQDPRCRMSSIHRGRRRVCQGRKRSASASLLRLRSHHR